LKGRIVQDDLDALRERADMVDVIGGYMKLRKAGRVFKGLCCFHQEKTASFTVDPAKQLYYCHGCGNGGDIFRFIQQTDGLTFNEAAQRLADRVGISLRYEGPGDNGGGIRSVLLAANKQARSWFAAQLAGPPGAVGLRYLEGRGFNLDDARVWALGFAPPGRDALFRHLLGAGYSSKQVVDAGLARVGEGGEHRDAFRNRVIFPVSDLTGQAVGFGARALGDDHPKYLNTPETAVYVKSKILFGLDRAKNEMVRSGFAVVTEGYTDVIALHKVGITNAVATCGTALGEEHFSLIKRFCERAILAFDADAAGALASERGFGIHARIGLDVLVAPLPAGQDPADVALREGRQAVDRVLASATSLMRFVLEREIGRHALDTAEGKARAVRAAVGLLAWEPNRIARSEHGFWVASRIGVNPQEVLQEIADSASQSRGGGTSNRARRPGNVKVEREALAILLDPEIDSDDSFGALSAEHFTQPEHRALFEAMTEAGISAGAAVMGSLPDDETRRLAAEISLAPSVTKNPEEVFERLEEFRIRRQIETLRSKLERLDPKADAAGYDALFSNLMELDQQRRRFDDR
jgi:DNA primase